MSVALATYNGERFLRCQLDSVYSQTHKNLEVVVCDDGSSDGTIDILKNYKKNHGLRLLRNEKNVGFVQNFAKAVSLCRGEFIALCDQDDIWFPEKIEILLSEIGNHSLICSDAELVDESGNIISRSLLGGSGHYAETDDQFRFFVFRNYVTGCTAMFRRDVADRGLPVPKGAMYHDWWFATVASTMDGVKCLDMVLTRYRQHSANDTGASVRLGLAGKFRESKEKKSDSFKREIEACASFLGSGVFNEREKSVIRDRLLFYSDLNESAVHFSAFRMAFRHRNYLLAGRSFFFKLAFLLGSLVK